MCWGCSSLGLGALGLQKEEVAESWPKPAKDQVRLQETLFPPPTSLLLSPACHLLPCTSGMEGECTDGPCSLCMLILHGDESLKWCCYVNKSSPYAGSMLHNFVVCPNMSGFAIRGIAKHLWEIHENCVRGSSPGLHVCMQALYHWATFPGLFHFFFCKFKFLFLRFPHGHIYIISNCIPCSLTPLKSPLSFSNSWFCLNYHCCMHIDTVSLTHVYMHNLLNPFSVAPMSVCLVMTSWGCITSQGDCS